MNRTQQKYLEERINQIANRKDRERYEAILPDPSEIAIARTLVKEYDRAQLERTVEKQTKIRKQKQTLLDTLYFKDEDTILKAIDIFEEAVF